MVANGLRACSRAEHLDFIICFNIVKHGASTLLATGCYINNSISQSLSIKPAV